MWARAAGMAAWLIGSDLPRPLEEAAVRLVAHEADRFVGTTPKSRYRGDTGGGGKCLERRDHGPGLRHDAPKAPGPAPGKKPPSPTCTTPSPWPPTKTDETPGDQGRPVREWVTTRNAHDDFMVENHGLVHVGYLKNSAAMLLEDAVHWMIAGREVPKAASHHVDEVFDILARVMAWEGSPLYFGGNDWKITHTQATDVIIYAFHGLLAGDARAAHLEDVALMHLAAIQEAENGFYNVRRDLEYGGLCATRLIACCLAHSVLPRSVQPMTAETFDRIHKGVTLLKNACAVIHRTPGKLVSFAWGRKRMALALPRDGNWVIWPHFASYLGLVNGKDASSRNVSIEDVNIVTGTDLFRVEGVLVRAGRTICQDFCVLSPPDDRMIYLERFRVEGKSPLRVRETGVIGLDYPLGRNTRILHGAFGRLEAQGTGGTRKVHILDTDWLNIDGRVGYVVRRLDGISNVMRFHDETEGSGRVPKLQEWISLVGEPEGQAPPANVWTCVVTLLNATAEETAGIAKTVTLEERDGDGRLPGGGGDLHPCPSDAREIGMRSGSG